MPEHHQSIYVARLIYNNIQDSITLFDIQFRMNPIHITDTVTLVTHGENTLWMYSRKLE